MIKRLLNIWLACWRYSLARELMFRGSLFLWVVVDLFWFIVQLFFIQVLYLHVTAIAGWTKWEMVLLIAICRVIDQMFQTLFLINFHEFPELVRNGRLDFYLLQPAPVLFLISTRKWDISGIFNTLFPLGLGIYAAMQIPVHFSAAALLTAVVLGITGIGIHYAVFLFVVTCSFWMTQAQGMTGFYYQAMQLARQPREVFHGVLRFVFTWIVPFLLVANLPARAFLSGFSWPLALWFVGSTATLLLLSIAFFHFGLRHYTSASS